MIRQRVRKPRDPNKPPDLRFWVVYVIQSLEVRYGKRGNQLPGFHYVGCTTDVIRRLRQHNGEITGGGKYSSMHRPWVLRAIFGPYIGQSNALKAERALKHGKRGIARALWAPEDSHWCCGLGAADPRIGKINAAIRLVQNISGADDSTISPTP